MVWKEGNYVKHESRNDCALNTAKGKPFRLDRSVFLPYLKDADSFKGIVGRPVPATLGVLFLKCVRSVR